MNIMSWISLILTIACIVWLVGLGIFVLIKKIQLHRTANKEIKKVENDINDYAEDK